MALVITATSWAQMADFDHPSTIMGQHRIAVEEGEAVAITTESLIIHDVDDDNNFSIKILKGKNYKVAGGKVTPNSGFSGLLTVNIELSDGKFTTPSYPLMVEVGDCSRRDSKVIYLACEGDDKNPGTESRPVATLQRAKELVREGGARMVLIRGGEYYMDKAVRFTAEDSGSAAIPILYKAYPGERVRFTGSVRLPYEKFEQPKPKQVEAIENVYVKAKIKVINLRELGITDYGAIDHVGYAVKNQPMPTASLFVDGAAMHLARYPNVGNFNDVKILGSHQSATRNVGDFNSEGTREQKTMFKTRSGLPFKWKQTGDIWIDGSMSKAWEWKKNRIAKLEPDSTITMEWEYHSKIGMQAIKMFYFNIFEELDFPEEYFVDKEQGLLYAFFPSCVSERSDIRLTQSTDNFIVLDGVEHLQFEDIAFEGTRNSAIRTSQPSSYNSFIGCEVYSCGLDAFSINGYGNRIERCHIHNIGSKGVAFGGGEYSSVTPARNIIESCRIHDFSQERRVYNPGVTFSGVGQVMRNSEIYNGPHMAMIIRGVNQIVEYCDFHDAPKEYSDMLGIYMCTGSDFFSRGSIIRRNKFHDVNGTWKQSAGVYMDNETNGIVVEENYFFDNVAQERGWSVMVHGGGDNMVRRNTFVDCSFPFGISTRLNGYAADRYEGILMNWQRQAQEKLNDAWRYNYPELERYFYDEDRPTKGSKRYEYLLEKDATGRITNYWNIRTPDTNYFYDNLVYTPDPSVIVMPKDDPRGNGQHRGYYYVLNFRSIDGKVVELLQHHNNHHVTDNPGFVDYAKHDLRVESGAPILKDLPYLQNSYFSEIGLKKSVGVR